MKPGFRDKVRQRLAYVLYFNERHKKEFERAQWLTPIELRHLQENKLKRIVKSAVETVPFYRNLGLNIDFEKFTLNELKKFPVIDKDIIRKNPELFISEKHKGIMSQTSGSSGVPFQFYVPYKSASIEKITFSRAWTMGKQFKYSYGDPVVMLRSYSPKKGEPLWYKDTATNFYFLSPFHINAENLSDYLKVIKQSGTKILRGYPSSLYIFTLLLKSNNIKLAGIEVLITSSETLLPHFRDEIEQYFGIKVLDWYGQNENTVTVQQCWAGNYHNNDDYGILEINSQNQIIATSLNNDVMPFIRYNTKDKAIPFDQPQIPCLCGRSFSVPFKAIEGRAEDILIKFDGTLIPTANFSTAMKVFTLIEQYQIIQHMGKDITLNLVTKTKDEVYLQRIKNEITQRLGEVSITIKLVDEIKRDIKTGKVKVAIQEGKIV